MESIAILGATGPTGIHLAAALRKNGAAVRVIARDRAKLDRLFGDPGIDKRPADVLDKDQTLRAIDGCERVYDCIGLPAGEMHLHPLTARNIAFALEKTKARCVHVSSYWAYLPQVRALVDESHPRVGGSPWTLHRREAEDILFAAGAAILHLPDFYGPDVHTSVLQNPLTEAARGKTMNWIGGRDVGREYIYIPDAMRIAAEIGSHAEAYGAHWCLPGSGPLTGSQVAEIAGRHLGRPVKLRAAGLFTLRIASLFSSDLRGLMQVAPDYMKPVAYDAGKLQRLVGPQTMTPYETGIGQTLQWIAAGA